MNEALNSGAVDVIGLARPLCTEASRSGFCTKHQGTFCNAKPYLRGVGFKGSWSLVLREPTAKEKTLTRVTRTVGTKQQNPRRAHQNPLCVCVSVSTSPTVSPSLFLRSLLPSPLILSVRCSDGTVAAVAATGGGAIAVAVVVVFVVAYC